MPGIIQSIVNEKQQGRGRVNDQIIALTFCNGCSKVQFVSWLFRTGCSYRMQFISQCYSLNDFKFVLYDKAPSRCRSSPSRNRKLSVSRIPIDPINRSVSFFRPFFMCSREDANVISPVLTRAERNNPSPITRYRARAAQMITVLQQFRAVTRSRRPWMHPRQNIYI